MINKIIKSQRINLGYSGTYVAEKAGISIHEYSDVELREDEFSSTLDLSAARRLLKVLELDFKAILEDPVDFCSQRPDLCAMPRNLLVRNRRNELGISVEDVASGVGFDVQTITAVEVDQAFLEGLPLNFAVDLAEILKIPAFLLVKEEPD